jgi:tripartite-type tricarboxylate transporter receptor subunit TctC
MLVSEYFKSRAGADYVDVNYRGASQAINDTIAGATQFCFVDFASATTAMKNRTLIPLGVSTPERYPLAPQLPTIAEQGLPGFSVSSLSGTFAPAKTPKDIITKLNTTFRKVLADPQVAARLKGMGFHLASSSSEELTQLLRAQAKQWRSFIKEHNIKFQR